MINKRLINKVGLGLAMVAVCGLVMSPCMAAAADVPVASEKSETVYVHTSADGSVKSVEVSTVLKNPNGAAQLADSSNLSDFKVEDDKTYTGSGDSIVWNTEGGNVEYTGQSSAAVPVSVKVSYTLDGQAISPEQLAGKSGRVTIRYDYANNSTANATVNGSAQSVYTPFTCVTAIMLDGDDFKNITVENAKIIEDGNDVIVAGYGMPGLKQSLGTIGADSDIPDHFTVSADATNFELKSTMTIVTAGLMSDVDTSSFGLESLDDASMLTDAMGQLIDGSTTLTDGLDELASGASKLEEGTASLLELSGGVANGIGQLASSFPGAVQGAADLESGIGSLANAVTGAKEKLGEFQSAISSYMGKAIDFNNALAVLAKYENSIDAKDYEQLRSALEQGVELSGVVDQTYATLGKTNESFDQLITKIEVAQAGAHELKESLESASGSAGELSGYANTLNSELGKLSESIPALTQSIQAAAEGSKKLTEGMQSFNDEGVSKLVDTLNNDYGGLLDRMNALSDAAKAYNNFGGITPGTTGSVKFVFETDGISKD